MVITAIAVLVLLYTAFIAGYYIGLEGIDM